MADCGCNSTPNCYTPNNVVQQVLQPVVSNDCYGNSGSASNCPPYFEPSTLTTDGCVTIPAVGATFNLPLICNASKFRLGMWIENPALGKYPIVGINAATNILTLRNSCADGTTAIGGNPEPGTQICGTQSIWVSGADPCRDAESFCEQTFECLQSIDEDNPLCLPNIPVTTDAQGIAPWGLTVSCDAGDCPQPDDPNCIAKLDGVRMYNNTICFEDGLIPQEPEEVSTMVSITEDGCLRASLAAGFVSLRIKIAEVNGSGDDSALNTALNFDVDTATFGVPDNAKMVAVRGFYYYDLDADAGNPYRANTYLRGPAETVNNPNTWISNSRVSGGEGQEWSSQFNAIVPVSTSDKRIYHEWQDLGTEGSHPLVKVYLGLDGYYV